MMVRSGLRLAALGVAGALVFTAQAAVAQTLPLANPLRAQTQSADESRTKAQKPKRQRSAKQLASDEKLRTCGKEWRSDKTALQAKGYTWIKFSSECRKRA